MQKTIYNDPIFKNSTPQQNYIKLYEKREKYGAIYNTMNAINTDLRWGVVQMKWEGKVDKDKMNGTRR